MESNCVKTCGLCGSSTSTSPKDETTSNGSETNKGNSYIKASAHSIKHITSQPFLNLSFSLCAPITSDQCHAWFHLNAVSPTARNTEQMNITKKRIHSRNRTLARQGNQFIESAARTAEGRSRANLLIEKSVNVTTKFTLICTPDVPKFFLSKMAVAVSWRMTNDWKF